MRVALRTIVPMALLTAVMTGSVIVESVGAQPAAPPEKQPGEPGRRGPGDRPPGGPDRGGAPSLGGAMRSMNRALKELKGSVEDASKRDQSLNAVWMMQAACATAKRTKPDHLEGDPVMALEGFRRDQIKLMGLLIELESDLMDGKTPDAVAMVAKVEAFEGASHEKYGVGEEKEGNGVTQPAPR